VDECGGLQGVPGILPRHLGGGELAEFLINEREQFLCSLRLALLDGIQEACDVAHGGTIAI
jgi:hypothetical protein